VATRMTLVERLSRAATDFAGSGTAFAWALALVAGWAAAGPLCRFSDTWQLVINTLTTLVTFLMVFLIQRTQNRDALAVQTKLNELLAAVDRASPRLINLEDLSEEDIRRLHERFGTLRGADPGPHSVGEGDPPGL
jgi:low affinity Fe/Cu permease